jgi:NADH oxidase (H2O-forming)
MKSLELKKDVYWVGALDPDLRIFDIIMYTPFGTTYNSYVVKGSEKVAVFETVKEKFFDEYLHRLESLDVDITKIDYIVVNHTEPDHAGSVAKLLDISKNAKVVGSAPAIKFMKKIANKPFDFIIVNDGDTLSLGNKTLRFVSAPFLHWPDSIYTYVSEDAVLFTCDSFGSHYCTDTIFNDLNANEENYMEALKYYYDTIMGPFKPHVLKALDKIKDFKIDMICTGHGPVLRDNPQKIIDLYKEWSEEQPFNDGINRVTVSYVSAYGYTEELAYKIVEGLKSTGNFEVKMFDVIHHDMKDIVEEIDKSDGILFGSPTINGDLLEPIRNLMTKLNPIVHGGKVAGAFGSYGWSGEAVPHIENRLKELRMKIVSPGLKVMFKPSEEDLANAYNYGKSFGERVVEEVDKAVKKFNAEKNGKSNSKNGNNTTNKVIASSNNHSNSEGQSVSSSQETGETDDGDGPRRKHIVGYDTNDTKASNSEETYSEKTYIIVGNGAAGYYAATSIRKNDPKAVIRMLSAEAVPTYYRPQLSDYLAHDLPDKKFYISPESWYKENNIDLMLNVKVSTLKTDDKKVVLEDGREFSYDKLILANGASNFVPKINGCHLKGVFTLKDIEDADNIKSYMQTAKKAVIIGGGLLGLEAAWEMKNCGLDVTVVEFFPRLLPRQLDDEGSSIFKSFADKSGIALALGDSVEEILSNAAEASGNSNDFQSNKVKAVKLKSGTVIETDMVLFSVGIRPNKSLAEESGIICNKGIVVNNRMETNIKDIYACGDIAELSGIVFGNWAAAVEMGKIAGKNAFGENAEFNNFVFSVIFKALNTEVFSAGTIDYEDKALKQLSFTAPEKGVYKKLFFKNEKLVGSILLGDIKKAVKILTSIKQEKNIETVTAEELLQ